jgi:hypothetical protein
MTPESQTIFSVILFLALVFLMQWSRRRHKVTRKLRVSVATAMLTGQPSHQESD